MSREAEPGPRSLTAAVRLKLALAMVASLLLPAILSPPLIAQEMDPAEVPLIQAALDRGQLLHAYDQAAWHGTDALLAAANARGLTDALPTMIGGWIAVGSANAPSLIFFDKNETDPRALFIVQLADGGRRVVSSRFVDAGGDGTIEADARSMIRARRVALASIAGAELLRCSKGNYNIAVLPPDRPGASTLVYVLSPQDELDRAPFGGHFRIPVAADGTAGPIHAFTKTCVDLPTSRVKDRPEALVVTQLADPLPTEIAVFTMFAANLPLYVGCPPDPRIWVVEASGGEARIRVVSDNSTP